MVKNLECSTQGDNRFSAWYARISVNGVENNIETHYQMSKVFRVDGELQKPNSPNQAKHWQYKGHSLVGFQVNGHTYPIEFMSMWYDSLWYKYLRSNSKLYNHACTFNSFTDINKKYNTLNCQADVIEYAVKNGLDALLKRCKPFLDLLVRDKRKS